QSQKQPSRQTRRPSGIGLRLAFVGQHGVEHMSAEAGLGLMPAAALLVAENPGPPAIRAAALGEIVDQLHMAVARRQLGAVDDAVEVDGDGVTAQQPAETVTRRLAAAAVIDDEPDR